MKRSVQLGVMRIFRRLFGYGDEIFSFFLNVCGSLEAYLSITPSVSTASKLLARIIMSFCLVSMFVIAFLSKALGLLEWSILGVLSLRRFDMSQATS